MTNHLALAPMPVGTVYVDASRTLVADVNTTAVRQTHAVKTATRVRNLPDATTPVLVDAGAAMKHIGNTSTPPTVGDAFASAASWAWVRYQWAFQTNAAQELVPTRDSLDLKRHHAAVFSEHVGLGVGLTIIEEALRRRHHGSRVAFYDLDFVLNGDRFDLHNRTARMPDYLAEVTSPAGRTVLYSIECKGQTRPSRRSALDQLARALTQVVGLSANGRDLPSYIVGTRVYPDRIAVQVVDPPEPLVVYNRGHEVKVTPPPGELTRDGGKLDLPLERLADRLGSVRAGRVLTAAGDFTEASRYLGAVISGEERRQGEFVSLNDLEIVGQTQSFTVLGEPYVAVRGASPEAVDTVRGGHDYVRSAPDVPAATWGATGMSKEHARREPSVEVHVDAVGVVSAVGTAR